MVAYVYNLSGNTNSDLSFNAWALESSLSVDEFDLLSKYGYVVFNNPGSSLNALVSVTDVYNVAAMVYDMKGRLVSIPDVVPNGEHSVILSDPLSNVGDGIYFVLIGGSGNTAFKFIKNHRNYSYNNYQINKSPLFKYAAAKANENYKI